LYFNELYYTVVHYFIAHYCTVLYFTAALCYTEPYCTVLHYKTLHCFVQRCPAPHYTTYHVYSTALRCTVLHCTALRCTVMHCTALYRTAFHSAAMNCITITTPMNYVTIVPHQVRSNRIMSHRDTTVRATHGASRNQDSKAENSDAEVVRLKFIIKGKQRVSAISKRNKNKNKYRQCV
jgi:hypothetical protein